jgi:predicted Fe-Mo cluster-binding NifX family protein
MFSDSIIAGISKRLASRSGWFCQKQGLRNLFKDIHLNDTQEVINKDVRLYRNISQKHGAQHTLEWAEQRGNNIMIVSRLSRNMGKHRSQKRLKLWTGFHKHIRDVINERIQEIESGKGELARAFHIIQVTNTPREVAWHLIRKHPGTCT